MTLCVISRSVSNCKITRVTHKHNIANILCGHTRRRTETHNFGMKKNSNDGFFHYGWVELHTRFFLFTPAPSPNPRSSLSPTHNIHTLTLPTSTFLTFWISRVFFFLITPSFHHSTKRRLDFRPDSPCAWVWWLSSKDHTFFFNVHSGPATQCMRVV